MSEIPEDFDDLYDGISSTIKEIVIGRTISKYIKAFVIQVEDIIIETEMKGKIIISYVGHLTEYAKQEIGLK